MAIAPGRAAGQTPPNPSAPAEAPQPPAFAPEEIEALVAPIALYPDALLAQVLMASTYPLEILHASRWVKENPKLKGDAAVKAVENQSWDVSVKSLVAFPQILGPMNDKLDWTQKLGDAFLAQQQDVFAAVQRLRKRAQNAGNLTSNVQQTVIVEAAPQVSVTSDGGSGGNIAGTTGGTSGEASGGTSRGDSSGASGGTSVVRIESTDPQVIYVPSYNPTVVYGGWSAPAYPPTYWPPPPAYYPGTALMTGLAWGVGVAAAGAIFSDCDWGGGDVDIDYNKVTNIDRNSARAKVEGQRAQGQGIQGQRTQGQGTQGQSGRWQHDPAHRQGVAYRDNATRDKMAGQVPGADKRAQYRGRDTATAAGAGTAATASAGRNAATGAGTGAGRNETSGAGNGAGRNAATGAGRNAAAGASTGARRDVTPGAGADRRGGASNSAATGNRASTTHQGNSANRTVPHNAARPTPGHGGGKRDNAFTGVSGGGAAAQRSYDRGRSSMQGSGASRPSGGAARGGGGGVRGGGGGGRR
ncbi:MULTISPECIES: DUF3300 domain-containing protein [unclassified Achromobacter]|uniref:DUF3300 domain-containing protein n=1 Tax=unclassified Achromobacter TaxID=2626865 RepID=UPI000B5189D2|nr:MULTISPECIES: DUF3300 domain-containing protein [unclassified Achromobacter]OWT75542.1 hypothetical protein CEY04_18380 [Achromobacter sp. HZ28]OWT76203.1 hypothetical protein CEY05_13830 [Achromobacter sp. HZ34]